MNSWKLSAESIETLGELEQSNRFIFRGYLRREPFAAILDRRQINVARGYLEWIVEALDSRLRHFEKAARTVETHIDGILEYVRTRFSNG